MNNKETIRTLIELSPMSMTKVAKKANVDQGNLSAWFTQDRYMSEEAIERIEENVGIEGSGLSKDRVFVWRVGRDFSALQKLIDRYFSSPQLMPVVKKRIRRYELSELFAKPMATLTDSKGHRALLILKTSSLKEWHQAAKQLPWFSPDFLHGTSWLQPVQDNQYPFPAPLQLKADDIQAWKNGDVSVEDFDALFIQDVSASWDQVIEQAENLGLDATTIMSWLEIIRDKNISTDDVKIQLANLSQATHD